MGIDRVSERIPPLIERLTADPARAAITLQVATELEGGLRCEVAMKDHTLVVDERPSLGGTDEGASPIELVLGVLASCQAITYRVWAAKLGVALDRVRVEVDGDIDLRGFFGIDGGARPGFGAIRLRVALEGPEPPERYRQLAETVDGHCPLLDLTANPVPVERTLITP